MRGLSQVYGKLPSAKRSTSLLAYVNCLVILHPSLEPSTARTCRVQPVPRVFPAYRAEAMSYFYSYRDDLLRADHYHVRETKSFVCIAIHSMVCKELAKLRG